MQSVSYDAAGNAVSDGGSSYTYDATGQQVSANQTALTMSYDGDRLRAKKTENNQTTYYFAGSQHLRLKIESEDAVIQS